MLHILLLILKIIGMILLVLLGLILLVLLTVLLVPVRYKGQGSYFGRPVGWLKVTWLLHIICLSVSYEGQTEMAVRLFGFRLFREGITPQQVTDEITEEAADTGDLRTGATDFDDGSVVSVQEVRKPITDPKTDAQETEALHADRQPKVAGTAPTKKKNIFLRIAERIRRFFRHLMLSLERLWDKLRQAKDAENKLKDFLTDEENKKTFWLILKQAKKIVHHILPRRLKGNITFGFDDPYRTGQVLTGAAFLYPLYCGRFMLQPVFDRKIIEGDIAFRGRIRMSVLLMAGIKILLNKNFRTQLRKAFNRGGMQHGR